VNGNLGRADNTNTDPVLGAHNPGTVFTWNGQFVVDGANEDTFIVVTNSGAFRISNNCILSNATASSTFSRIRVVGDGTGTFELMNGFLANHGASLKLGTLNVGAAILKTNTTSNLPTSSIS